MNPKSRWILSILIEIPVYAAIVVAYFYLVLRLLGSCTDLIVTGSTRTSGVIGAYVMGDVTAAVVDGAECAVLVVRAAAPHKAQSSFFQTLRRLFEG